MTAPPFWLHERGDALMQFGDSDRLSSVFSTHGQSVAEPKIIRDLTTGEARRDAYEHVKAVRPRVVWISPEKNIDKGKTLDTLINICNRQRKDGNYFVFAYPYFSTLWNMEKMQTIVHGPDMTNVQINMQRFDPRFKRIDDPYLCLASNLPSWTFEPMRDPGHQVEPFFQGWFLSYDGRISNEFL